MIRSRRRWFAVALVLVQSLVAQPPARPEDDADDALPPSGLRADYRHSAGNHTVTVSRIDALPALRLSADQSPDARLPADGWSVRWQGLLDIQQSDDYLFLAHATGRLRISIAGQTLLEAERAAADVAQGTQVHLPLGRHPIAIEFQPARGAKWLAIQWQSASFDREPLPAHALGHRPEDQPAPDLYLAGRLAVEEHGCASCHQRTASLPLSLSLAKRSGPKLAAARRLNAAWVYRWLGDPAALRAEAVMPRLFAGDRHGEVERYAVARFLTASPPQAGPRQPVSPPEALLAKGRLLYERSGCVVCHEKQEAADGAQIPARATLTALAHKTTLDELAAFILDPYQVDPSGRMPKLGLSPEECQAVAAYLAARDANELRPLELPPPPSAAELRQAFHRLVADDQQRRAFEALDFDQQLSRLARQTIADRRCANCHDLGQPNDQLLRERLAEGDFARIARAGDRGCLSVGDSQGDAAPRFGPSLDRQAVQSFLKAAFEGAGATSPAETARLTLARFNCTGCHQRDAAGGLSATMMRLLAENQTAAEAEQVKPPTLSAITAKLRPEALRAVLLEGARSRPWMALRMPHFPQPEMAELADGLVALDGDPPRQQDGPQGDATAEMIDAGRSLVGSQGFGCIKCHDIRGVPTSGTRGPDLARIAQRIEFDWYRRWMRDPQRIEPGTRMPTVFFAGVSPHKEILDGDPHRQTLAMWHYLAQGDRLELPEGLEPAKIKETIETSRPLVLRTFLPDLSPRSLAIRFANGVHVAYDAQNCRAAYAWQGGFLDLGPVWTGRGGRPAGIEGTIFWTAPAGFPWMVRPRSLSSLPDFASQASDVSLGAQPPDDGAVHRTRLHFRGYRLEERGPSFRYELELPRGQLARFDELLATVARPDAMGLLRSAVVQAPAETDAWLLVALCDKPPQARLANGALATSDPPETLLDGATPLATIQNGKPILLRLLNQPVGGTAWVTSRQGDRWVLLLRAPLAAGRRALDLAVIAPLDGRPETIDRLLREPPQVVLSR